MNTDTREAQHILINDLQVSLRELEKLPRHSPDHHMKPWIAKSLKVPESAIQSYELKRRSLDARKKPDLQFIYQLECMVDGNHQVLEGKNISVISEQADTNNNLYQLDLLENLPQNPIIIGTGPSGIMAAYLLALHGLKPIVIDRGFGIEKRAEDIEKFQKSHNDVLPYNINNIILTAG